MPETNGQLTSEDFAKLKLWWDSRWKGPVVCPVCKTTAWTTNAYLIQFDRYHSTTPGLKFPHVHVQCDHCGHSMFLNAVKIGIVQASNG